MLIICPFFALIIAQMLYELDKKMHILIFSSVSEKQWYELIKTIPFWYGKYNFPLGKEWKQWRRMG